MPLILSQLIEVCRWLGAFTVLAVHATNMFVSLGDIMTASHSAPVYGWWFLSAFEFGHQAVVGFFVISGYLVGGAVLAALKKQQDFLREYLIHRFARIYIVLVPALLLTFVFDSTGRGAFPATGVYDWPVFQGHFSPSLFLGNLANVQGILVDFYGTNGPLWSLACEFWYYITFPLLLLPFAKNYSPFARYGGFAVGAAMFLTLAIPQSIWFRFGYVIWGLGAAATLAPRPLVKSRWLALAIFVAAIIPIRLLVRGPLLAAHPWLQDGADFICAALFANLLVTVRFAPQQGWALVRPKLHKRLADFSFSLYSIHMPTLILMRAAAAQAMGADWAKQLATPLHWVVLFSAMAITILVAYGFSRATEARTSAARRVLRQAFLRSERPLQGEAG